MLQKRNSMQYLQKHGSVVTLQICNSMQFPAKYSKRMPLQKCNSMQCTAIYCHATYLWQHAVCSNIQQTYSVVKTHHRLCYNLRLWWSVSKIALTFRDNWLSYSKRNLKASENTNARKSPCLVNLIVTLSTHKRLLISNQLNTVHIMPSVNTSICKYVKTDVTPTDNYNNCQHNNVAISSQ